MTDELIRQIEYVLPKLKYSLYIRQVTSWLENFEEHEVPLALDYLFYLEYISFSELQSRLNQQLDSLDKHYKKKHNYLLIPFGVYPKSNDIVMYLISKCTAYKKLKEENRIEITTDIQSYAHKKKSLLVYVDDFIGTGKSFNKWYKKNKIDTILGFNTNVNEEQAILSAIIMEDGHEFIKYRYPDINVFADFRSKIFSTLHSPFNLSGNRIDMRNLCLKYGTKILTDFRKPNIKIYAPFGFDNSEALVAFDYGTPNNSLSIIWGDNDWRPIFPRSSKSRMKKASEIKGEAAFYLGLMHKLKISLDDDINMTIQDFNIQLSARDDHAILVYLVLTDKHFSLLQVCQVLGITIFELKKIISKAHTKRLVTNKGEITRRGSKFLTELKKVGNIYKFRENDNLEIRENKIFVPKTFRKIT